MKRPSLTLVTCTLLIGLLAPAASAQYKDMVQGAQAKQRAGKYAEARKDFEAALKLASSGPEKADAQIGIGITQYAEKNYGVARTEFAEALAVADATPEQKAQAQMFIGHSWARECENRLGEAKKAYADALIAYAKVPEIPGVSPGQKGEARMAAVNTLFAVKDYAEARLRLKNMLEAKDLPPGAPAHIQVLLGRSYLLERNYAAARGESAKALAMEEISAADKADAQLQIGLSDYEAQDYARAKPELEKAQAMPGATDRQIHEATLRLRLRKLIPGGEKVLTVLFIGASHTQVWEIPRVVEALAASAPAGRPRIIAGEYLRGGTAINKFWEEGAGPDTARGRIVAEPWDFMVFECYPFIAGYDECAKYAASFANLARAGNTTPILFDAPAFFKIAYPADCQKNHDENVALARELRIPVAAAGGAWIKYLGPSPTPEQRLALYHPDRVHTSRTGAYMLACSIYSAITGQSPLGLTNSIPSFAPEEISKETATALQEASWKAFQESNPGLRPLP